MPKLANRPVPSATVTPTKIRKSTKPAWKSSSTITPKVLSISKITPEDHFEQNKFDLSVDFSSPHYGQAMQGHLLVFNPAVVEIPPSIAPVFPKDEKRAGPIVLRATLYRKIVHVKLPAGFTVDESPSPVKLESALANSR